MHTCGGSGAGHRAQLCCNGLLLSTCTGLLPLRLAASLQICTFGQPFLNDF